MPQTLHGGPLNGHPVSNQNESSTWIKVHTVNGKVWQVPSDYHIWHEKWPDNVVVHGYRKQKNKRFEYAWSRPVPREER